MTEINVTTFGCRLNTFESEIMRRHALAAGLDDVVIIHSCAVTSEAERQVRQAIRRARREHPGKWLVVTGCAVQIDQARFRAMPEIDVILGNDEKLKLAAWQAIKDGERPDVGDIMQVRRAEPVFADGFEGRTRAFLSVQNGCDHRCTFCIIPFGRGNSRSLPGGAIVEQARKLVEAGYAEIVITGVDITSYGKDLSASSTLGSMLKTLLRAVPELPRLRLSSIDPAELDDDLLDLIANDPRLMPHLHLSLQAGDDIILKRMKRRHGRQQALDLIGKLQLLRPGIVFGADLIAGFPTETEEMFERSLAFVEEAQLVHLHVFPYSARPGTPAARMPQLEKPVRKQRAQALREAGQRQLQQYLEAQIGNRQNVLIERHGGGLSEGSAICRLSPGAAPDRPLKPGRILRFRPLRVVGSILEGVPTKMDKLAQENAA